MNTNGKNIVDRLAAMLSLQDRTKEELEAIIQRYPYFALARFLVSRKIKDEQGPDADTQLQKAVLYFYNPLWFEYLATDSQVHLAGSLNENSSITEQGEQFSETD